MRENGKRVLMVMPVMKGGGAERVASLLLNAFQESGIRCEFLLTSCTREQIVAVDLHKEIPITVLQEKLSASSTIQRGKRFIQHVYSSVFCKTFEQFHKAVPAHFAYSAFVSQYAAEIAALRCELQKDPDRTVIAFLQPTIPMVLLAARGLPNRVIISERGNPKRLVASRYGRAFMEQYYARADCVVFQTEDARNSYPKTLSEKGVVIPNPIKPDLPAPYHGQRNKTITTFCRVSKQKNLPLLVRAFALLKNVYPDYSLHIIGDAINEEGEEVFAELHDLIEELHLPQSVSFLPFSKNVHEQVLQDAMYVNSSDYEGISNAMLEAMAIGMPVVCTDCPIGGARASIRDGVDGLLVPTNDVQAMAQAMERIVRDKALSDTLSANSAELRTRLGIRTVANKWMELLQ